jgi:succinate-semialdehyde dehydrogenase / glutarate-semialdehyde dehydrogenase
MTDLLVTDPATGELVGALPVSDADALVAAARSAHTGWERAAPAERAALVKAGAARLREAVDEIALLQTREGGKPLADSRGGVEAGIGALEQYAELGPLHRGRSLQGGWGATDWMMRVSRGVAALCLPWNDPVAIACTQIGANLVVGNAVVCKPSEKTPLSTVALVRLLAEGLPTGVLQTAVGDGTLGAALAGHPGVDVVVHVGSAATGRSVAAACAARGAKAVLELGGKDAMVVDASSPPRPGRPSRPPSAASRTPARSARRSSGCTCTATSPPPFSTSWWPGPSRCGWARAPNPTSTWGP